MQSLRKISVRFAGSFLMVLMSCVVLFHLLVLAQVIPDNVVWGGRFEDDAKLFLFEAFAPVTLISAISYKLLLIAS